LVKTSKKRKAVLKTKYMISYERSGMSRVITTGAPSGMPSLSLSRILRYSWQVNVKKQAALKQRSRLTHSIGASW